MSSIALEVERRALKSLVGRDLAMLSSSSLGRPTRLVFCDCILMVLTDVSMLLGSHPLWIGVRGCAEGESSQPYYVGFDAKVINVDDLEDEGHTVVSDKTRGLVGYQGW